MIYQNYSDSIKQSLQTIVNKVSEAHGVSPGTVTSSYKNYYITFPESLPETEAGVRKCLESIKLILESQVQYVLKQGEFMSGFYEHSKFYKLNDHGFSLPIPTSSKDESPLSDADNTKLLSEHNRNRRILCFSIPANSENATQINAVAEIVSEHGSDITKIDQAMKARGIQKEAPDYQSRNEYAGILLHYLTERFESRFGPKAMCGKSHFNRLGQVEYKIKFPFETELKKVGEDKIEEKYFEIIASLTRELDDQTNAFEIATRNDDNIIITLRCDPVGVCKKIEKTDPKVYRLACLHIKTQQKSYDPSRDWLFSR